MAPPVESATRWPHPLTRTATIEVAAALYALREARRHFAPGGVLHEAEVTLWGWLREHGVTVPEDF